MKALRRLPWRMALRAVILAAVLFFTVRGVPAAFTIYLSEVIVQEEAAPGQVRLVARGGNMYRPNSFYLDGKRVKDADVVRSTYEECFVTVDESVFAPGQWYRMEVGFSRFGVINLLSTPVWMQWPAEEGGDLSGSN